MSEIDPEIAERLQRHAHSVVVSPDLPERIVRQALTRRRRRRSALVGMPVALVVALAITTVVLLPGGGRTTPITASAGPAVHGAASSEQIPKVKGAAARPVLLAPTGVGPARFGEATISAIAHLKGILGRPETANPQPDVSCDVTSTLAWRGFTGFFDHGRFVGYSTTRKTLATLKGLRSGDTVATARAIYGGAFHLSMAQGGSYRITLSTGALTGYVRGGVTATTIPLTANVDGIFAGAVGCPGISP
ncbi:MAG: hypothetical protein ACYCV7_14440 [Acidimicrobiales bacterium]